MARRHATLVEVARHSGVSLATASRVLNGSSRQVSQALRDRVLASARELGYVPNASAQALARNSSTLFGLIVHDITDPYFSSIAAGVSRVTEQAGLVVVLGMTNREPDRELSLLATLRAHRARAVVIAGSRTASETDIQRLTAEIDAFVDQGGRVACISQPGLPADTVVPENQPGAEALATALAEQGHRRFAVLAGPPDLLTASQRLAGFRTGLATAGIELPDSAVVHGDFTREAGYQAALELIERRTGATCVFAVNDVMALGALGAFRERGLDVPGDVSLSGFGDIPPLRYITPALTTVRLPIEELGERAALLALGEGTDTGTERQIVRIGAEVVLRASTAAPTGPGLA
ncbi:LacI family transcriptional regulator [Pseudonocardiaceae bacterium YIM PH 21723]|nr:LacI family transcriptional regulator [Pseudonocardiaceae bacterium YIM PH 21723]